MGRSSREQPRDSRTARHAASTAPATDPANMIGRQIGRYLIQRFLGSGGAASVYQAYDQVQGQAVALKMLASTADEKTLARFRREAMTSGALRHPHIVRTIQVGMSGGDVPYLAMELITGESLSELLTRTSTLPPQESCAILEPIAAALAHAHSKGVVHRDVKPSNILMRPVDGGNRLGVQLESLDHPVVPMLSDFGIARTVDSPDLTSTGRTVGTPSYMAPEQCAGRRGIDGRSDIYSLGAVLYRCLAGRPPFSGTTTQILHAHVYEPLRIEEDLYQRLSPLVIEILQRSLSKLPDERYGNASEMAAALAQAAGRPPTPKIDSDANVGSEYTATMTMSTLPAEEPTESNYTVLVPGDSASGRFVEPPTTPPASPSVLLTSPSEEASAAPRSATTQSATAQPPKTPSSSRATVPPLVQSNALPRRRPTPRASSATKPPSRTGRSRRGLLQHLETMSWGGIALISVGTLLGAFLAFLLVSGPLRNLGSGGDEPTPATTLATATDVGAKAVVANTPTTVDTSTPDNEDNTDEPESTSTSTSAPPTTVVAVEPTAIVTQIPTPLAAPTLTLSPTDTPLPTLPSPPTFTPLPTATWTVVAEQETPTPTETATPTDTATMTPTLTLAPTNTPFVPTPTPQQTPPTPTWTPASSPNP